MPRHDGPAEAGVAAGYGLVLAAAACWACGGLMAKWLFTPPGTAAAGWLIPPLGIDVDPSLLSAARALVSFTIVLGVLALAKPQRLRVRLRDLPFLAAFGVFGLALVHFAYFKTISLAGVATAILLEYLAPVLVLAVSVAWLKERLTWSLPAAVAMSVLGCALMVGVVGAGGLTISGEALAWGLSSAVFFAGYALMGRYASSRFSPWTLLAYGLGAATLFWFAVLGGPGPIIRLLADPRAAVAVGVLAVVSTVIPFGAFLKALHHIEATKASVTSTVEPVLAGLGAWVLFAEHLTALQLLGGGLVIAAVAVSQTSTATPTEMPLLPDEGP